MSDNVASIKKPRRPRSPSPARPAFVVVQILNEAGEPDHFDKKRLRIVSVERSAEKVMEMMEDGVHTNAFYLRVMIPANVARPGVPRRDQPAAA